MGRTVAVSNVNADVSAHVRKKRGNGFSGSPNSLIGIAKPEPVLLSVCTTLSGLAAIIYGIPECRLKLNQTFPNLCRCPSRESEYECRF